ncbi:hypothetical protein IMSAGC018_01964 [Lachnospiraceae bacterium]|nr:hypothetical protein IMSAGC018_01964 [Lachnospiraceae bacterium]
MEMKVENILAKNITAAGDGTNYDAACKRLLANKVILTHRLPRWELRREERILTIIRWWFAGIAVLMEDIRCI